MLWVDKFVFFVVLFLVLVVLCVIFGLMLLGDVIICLNLCGCNVLFFDLDCGWMFFLGVDVLGWFLLVCIIVVI